MTPLRGQGRSAVRSASSIIATTAQDKWRRKGRKSDRKYRIHTLGLPCVETRREWFNIKFLTSIVVRWTWEDRGWPDLALSLRPLRMTRPSPRNDPASVQHLPLSAPSVVSSPPAPGF